jgi:hypothetical protein
MKKSLFFLNLENQIDYLTPENERILEACLLDN